MECQARTLSSSEEDGKPRSTGSRPPTKAKPRKATNTMRREEILDLQDQINQLQAQLSDMQKQPQPIASSEDLCGDCVRIKGSNYALREAVRQQNLMLAGAHAVFTEYTRLQPSCAIERCIRLGEDRASRQATLLRMKAAKIADAHAFLERRCPRFSSSGRLTDGQQFDTPDGDVITVRLCIEKLQGARSVKQAYDVMLNQMYNVELRVSEQLGNITIREDDDSGDKEFQQIRLVAATPWSVALESNSVVFHSYKPQDEVFNQGRECAIVTSDFVDEDALYPFQPSERVRTDTCAIIRLTSHRTGPGENDVEVVATRWSQMRMHRPAFYVPHDLWQEIVASMDRWAEVFLDSIREALKTER